VQILLRKAIQLSTEVRGANNASTIERLLQLGDYYRNIDVNYADSAKLYSEAAERFRKAYGDNESVLAEQIKLRSGIAASLSHDYKEAVLLLEQANKLALRLCPADQVDESATWLATVVSDSGDHLRAAHIWEANAQYVAIHMGKNSFEMGASIHGAGEQYLKAGDKKSAVRLLKQAVSIFEHCSNQIFLETAKQNLRIAES
jgi:tetratricopeptide (TPR) repeat protein